MMEPYHMGDLTLDLVPQISTPCSAIMIHKGGAVVYLSVL
jgi:hypothetical protein